MSSQLSWYIARSAGMVSWALLVASVLWGLALSTKVFGKKPRPNWILDLHRWFGGLALTFTAIHVLAIVADSYVHFGLADILVPFHASWHPTAVAWGVVSLYMLGAVELTSLARSHLPKKLWRGVHLTSFALFFTATMHGLTAGTDRGLPMVAVATFVALILFCILAAVRLLTPPRPATERIPAAVRTPARTPQRVR